MILLLIRHGRTDAVASYLAGRTPGVCLTERGRQQARRLSEILGALSLASVCSSPLERTLETAAPIAAARHLSIDIRPDLAEVDFGDWTGMTFADLERDPRWRAYNTDREHAGIPGGESLHAVQRRAITALREIRTDYGAGIVVAVSHAEVIRCTIGGLRGVTLDQALQLKIEPAKITLLRGSDLAVRDDEINLDVESAVSRL